VSASAAGGHVVRYRLEWARPNTSGRRRRWCCPWAGASTVVPRQGPASCRCRAADVSTGAGADGAPADRIAVLLPQISGMSFFARTRVSRVMITIRS
jgi:hypothetical protein